MRLVVFGWLIVASLLPGSGVAASSPHSGGDYHGIVVAIIDGARLRLAHDGGGEIRVRLTCGGTDPAPSGEALDDALSDLLLGRRVTVHASHWDRGYLVGEVTLDGASITGEMRERELLSTGPESDSCVGTQAHVTPRHLAGPAHPTEAKP
jgi:hypothetical protein